MSADEMLMSYNPYGPAPSVTAMDDETANAIYEETATKINDIKSAADILDAAAATYRERNLTYGSNYLNVGEAMKGFFPNGIELKTANDHLRFHLFCWIVGKLSRYANQWEKGHQDSIHDTIVYAAMLEANPP